jgi:Alpha/beta hydrolase domain
MRSAVAGLALLLAGATVTAACSSGDDGSSGGGDASGASTTAPVERPAGPAATFAALKGGKGIFLGASGPGPSLSRAGYTEAEYSASGTATSYTSAEALPTDGRFSLTPDGKAPYATRVVVRRPAKQADFNGTVVVEWLNVSGGVDASPDYTYLADELLRRGYAWVGVSAQRIGVEGGAVAVSAPGAEDLGAGKGLKGIDPARYGKLHHPGDAYSYDIYTQVARALRSAGKGKVDALDGLRLERVLGVGESQSAFALTTYINGVQPLAEQYDGFLVHSRGGAAAPLGKAGAGIDIAGTIGGKPTTIRTDGRAPVIVVETETDLLGILGYLPARQDDGDGFRLWEVAGTAHADKFQLGDTEGILGCAQPINRGQQVFVLRSALRHLDRWGAGGDPPPKAPRLDVEGSAPTARYALDDVGNVKGGIRSPVVDAPVDVLSGMASPDSSIICLLMGSTTEIPTAKLAKLYDSRAAYTAAYEKATDDMIKAGFALRDDRTQILDQASPDRIKD